MSSPFDDGIKMWYNYVWRLSMYNDLELAYLAGFFDADGCITITRLVNKRYSRGIHYALRAMIGQRLRSPLEQFNLFWGGSLCYTLYRGTNCPNPQWIWSVGHRKALLFLQDIVPCLRLKQEQAETAIAFQLSVPKQGHALTNEEFVK